MVDGRGVLERLVSGIEASRRRLEEYMTRGREVLEATSGRQGVESPESVCSRARSLNAAITCSEPGGKALAVKDIFPLSDAPAGFGTGRLLLSGQEHPVISKLRRSGYAQVIRANMDLLSLSTTGFNPVLGNVLNPYNEKYTAGGSSGGSAALSRLHPRVLGLGSDAGGSIRIPAAYTGVYGLKLVETKPPLPISPSMEAIGLTSSSLGLLYDALSSIEEASPSIRPSLLLVGLAVEGLAEIPITIPSDMEETLCKDALSGEPCEIFHRDISRVAGSGYFSVSEARLGGLALQYERPRAAVTLHEAAYSIKAICRSECMERLPDELRGILKLGSSISGEAYSLAKRTLEKYSLAIEALVGSSILATPVIATEGCITEENAARYAYSRKMIVFTSIANVAGLYSITVPVGSKTLDCGAPSSILLSSSRLENILAAAVLISWLHQ